MHIFNLIERKQFKRANEVWLSVTNKGPVFDHMTVHLYFLQGKTEESIDILEEKRPTWKKFTLFIKKHNLWNHFIAYLDTNKAD